jgi:hypothetical protein
MSTSLQPMSWDGRSWNFLEWWQKMSVTWWNVMNDVVNSFCCSHGTTWDVLHVRKCCLAARRGGGYSFVSLPPQHFAVPQPWGKCKWMRRFLAQNAGLYEAETGSKLGQFLPAFSMPLLGDISRSGVQFVPVRPALHILYSVTYANVVLYLKRLAVLPVMPIFSVLTNRLCWILLKFMTGCHKYSH